MSVVWLAVFATLCLELIFTAVLVAPLPIVVRNGIARFIYRHKIGEKLSFFLRFATLALMFAVWDSVQVRWDCPRWLLSPASLFRSTLRLGWWPCAFYCSLAVCRPYRCSGDRLDDECRSYRVLTHPLECLFV